LLCEIQANLDNYLNDAFRLLNSNFDFKFLTFHRCNAIDYGKWVKGNAIEIELYDGSNSYEDGIFEN
jgi:hypothetical protein